jgi:hypothetical protein
MIKGMERDTFIYYFVLFLLLTTFPPSFWGCATATQIVKDQIDTAKSVKDQPTKELEKDSEYIKATPDADRPIILQSNKERTSFYIDGNLVVKGKRVKVLVNNQPHTITAQPDGYVSKEEFIQPPYYERYTVGFYYLIEDQIKGPPALPLKPLSIEIIYPADKSKTKLSEIELKIRISDESNIMKISIFVNGKESVLNKEQLRSIELSKADEGHILTWKASLTEGRNVILVQATDQDNNVGQASVSLIREGKEIPQPLATTSKIWLLAIGISKYKDKNLNLQFADQDARAIYNLLTAQGIVNRVGNSNLLLNEQATRVNVVMNINNMFKQAFEEDLIILYFAMHGMVDPDGSELYFIGYDTDPRSLVAEGIAQTDIEKALAKSKVGKVLMIVDTCHSGSAGLSDVFARRSVNTAAVTNRLLNRIAETKKGISIFSASSSTEFSQEDPKWGGGHGIFTHYLVEGLNGKADENNDKFITLRELYEYTYRNVKENTGGNQHPEIKGTLDTNIPLAEIKN